MFFRSLLDCRGFHLLALLCAAFAAALTPFVSAAEISESRPSVPQSTVISGEPLAYGYVILDGEYLPSPYVVSRSDKQLWINGREIDTARFPELPRRGPAQSGRGQRRAFAAEQARIERVLLADGLVLDLGGELPLVLVEDSGIVYPVLETLISKDLPRADKIRALMEHHLADLTSADWANFLTVFTVTPALQERMDAYHKILASVPVVNTSRPFQRTTYILTVLGMALAVVAFGTVLGHRPHQGKWREQNRTDDAVRLVVVAAALIALLSVFDLVCTYFADQSSGFWEVNPYGAVLLKNPLALIGFKLAGAAVAVVILLKLRTYRGTQLASWWLCLVMALVTARWVVFNSMLLT